MHVDWTSIKTMLHAAQYQDTYIHYPVSNVIVVGVRFVKQDSSLRRGLQATRQKQLNSKS